LAVRCVTGPVVYSWAASTGGLVSLGYGYEDVALIATALNRYRLERVDRGQAVPIVGAG
jgi:hypothetical protein